MTQRPSYMGIPGILLSLSLVSGCSFVFSEGAPNRHETLIHFNCGESVVPPIVDTVVTGVSVLQASASYKNPEIANPGIVTGVFIATAALYGASAIYGYVSASDCREAQQLRLARNLRQQSLPPPYGQPPYGQPPAHWPPPQYQLNTPAPAPVPPPAAAPPAPPPQ